MAHIAKYKAPSVGHMLAHYRRDCSSLERDNIDPERIKNDLVVGHYTNKDGKLVVGRVEPREGEPNWGTVESRIERVNEAQKAAGKRATRKDAVVMADVVVTLPDNVRKGDEDRFFRLTYWYLSKKFGIENMMGGYVHKDEVLKDGTPARDHMHVPFTPILDGRFNYKQMCPRSFYQSMHKELGDYLEGRMGYRPAIELDEETRAQRVYTDKSVDIDKVRGAVDRAVVQPAEDEAERIVAAAKEEAAALLNDAELRKAELVTAQRDKALAEVEKADRELSRVRAQVTECKAKIDGFAARFEKLKTELAQIAEALSVRGFLGSFKAKLIEFAENEICKAALAAGRDFKTVRDGKRAERVLVNGAREKVDEMSALGEEMDKWTLFDEVDEVRAASKELERSGGRGWDDGAR